MIGSPHVHHRVTDSTNARARDLAVAGAPHGTLVTADRADGRPRPSGPRLDGGARRRAAPVAARARRRARRGAAAAGRGGGGMPGARPVDAAIKWPNDIWISRRKVAGILLEGRPQEGWAVVGIGLNVRTREFPEELRDIATSPRAGGSDVGGAGRLAALLPQLDRWLGASPADVLEAWRARDALLGSPVSWAAGAGTAAGIADSGALIVETGDGDRVELDAGGEVHLGAGAYGP